VARSPDRARQEAAGLLAKGASNKEIARQLDITERTVKAHVGAMLKNSARATGCSSRSSSTASGAGRRHYETGEKR
jgi:DNA-binding NarL/FixJ family response regulator